MKLQSQSGAQSINVSEPSVRIHIDRESYTSPNPTTGADLYILGGVGDQRELFREVDDERELVTNAPTLLHLNNDEHFYIGRAFRIIVNARELVVNQETMSFDQAIALAFHYPPIAPNLLLTVTYRNGSPQNPEGSLLAGQSVKIKGNMVFNVTPTNKS